MRALVTGAGGFVGQWLVQAMLERGWTVAGLGPEAAFAPGPHVALAPGAIDWIGGCDVRRRADLAAALERARPDAIVHLAGIAASGVAAKEPELAVATNVTSTVLLADLLAGRLEAEGAAPRLLVIGSGEQYGRHDEAALPLGEDAPLRPHNLYAATKVAQEAFALQAHRTRGVDVVCARPFNHTGPGQNPAFLVPALVGRALALRAQPAPRALTIGNVHPVRDFLDVRDVVRAYIVLLERGVAGTVYNVSSGTGTAVGELARRVLGRVGVDATLEPDPALQRPADVPALVGDPARLRALGWTPTRDVDAIIDDLIHAASH